MFVFEFSHATSLEVGRRKQHLTEADVRELIAESETNISEPEFQMGFQPNTEE